MDTIFSREARFYTSNKRVWEKAGSAINGGREYIRKTLKRHPSETEEEYEARVDSSYNINLIKYSTKRFGDYIFSKPPRRTGANQDILLDFDRNRHHADTLMRNVFDLHTIFSLVWIFVDMPVIEGDLVDLREKKEKKIRPYVKAVSPLSVPDWCFNDIGELDWVILKETVEKKPSPFVEPELWDRRIVYTRDYWQMFERKLEGNYPELETKIGERMENKLGMVPVIPYTTMLPEGLITVPPIDDLLTIHDAVLAGESELLTNILKQTYGQLVLPSSTSSMVNRIKARLLKGNEGNFNTEAMDKQITREVSTTLSRTKAIIEMEEEKGTARYIQPEGATIESIIRHDDRLIGLMMRLYGFLMGEHTTQRESAESKSADNISLASQLSGIAVKLQELEFRIWEMMNMYDPTVQVPTIEYNTNYNINELNAVIAGMVELVNLDCGDEYNRQLRRTAVDVLNSLHHIPDPVYETIRKEIEQDKEAGEPISFKDKPSHLSDASGDRPDHIKSIKDYDKSKKSKMPKSEGLG